MPWLVHPGEFEDEVGHATEEKNNGQQHSNLVLSTSPESRQKKDDDRDGNSGNRHPFLSIPDVADYDDELYGEAEEEEKIKLQQGNENLYQVKSVLPQLNSTQ